ncbi:MAG: hypothetical protein R8M38_09230 [Mariprofundaceae bacterium]
MPHALKIAVIHGIGSQNAGYSHAMRDEINAHLAADKTNVAWGEIFWAEVLAARERDYLKRAYAECDDLDWKGLRRLMVNGFADAAAYRKDDGNNTAYADIHRVIGKTITDLDDGSNAPLLILAHSLGGHIISSYIYDMQQASKKEKNSHLNKFQRMETLTGIVTFGCNIPFFTIAHHRADIRPIRFPGNALTPEQAAKSEWNNYYDPDDVLAYPLKAINKQSDIPDSEREKGVKSYDETVKEDISINAGNIVTSWNPTAHSGYWQDNDFTKPVAAMIKRLIT